MFSCGNLFSKTNGTWEFIFEEKALFEISENKNLSKITSYTVCREAGGYALSARAQCSHNSNAAMIQGAISNQNT